MKTTVKEAIILIGLIALVIGDHEHHEHTHEEHDTIRVAAIAPLYSVSGIPVSACAKPITVRKEVPYLRQKPKRLWWRIFYR